MEEHAMPGLRFRSRAPMWVGRHLGDDPDETVGYRRQHLRLPAATTGTSPTTSQPLSTNPPAATRRAINNLALRALIAGGKGTVGESATGAAINKVMSE